MAPVSSNSYGIGLLPAGGMSSSQGGASSFLIATMLALGLYAPMSFDGSFSTPLWGSYFGILLLLLLALMARKDGLSSIALVANSVLMIAALFLATMISPFPDYRWGGILAYLALAVLFPLNLRELSVGRHLRGWITVSNVINVAVGIAVILHSDVVGKFLIAHYSAAYPELVPFMIDAGKPVLTFATHSVSAFFYYLFFFINFETFKIRKTWCSFVFAICYVGLGFALLSLTGIALMCFASFQVLRYLMGKRPKLVLGLAVVAGGLAFSALDSADIDTLSSAGKSVGDIITAPSGGFLGRFTQLGTLSSTLDYIRERPLTPVGFGYRSDLMFGDSGPVEYYIRGSVVLLVGVYVGLFVFLRRNLLSNAYSRLLFFVILAFEMGFSSMLYVRTLFLLPVFIVYLNDLSRKNLGDEACSWSKPVIA